jgi:hypothetical protein
MTGYWRVLSAWQVTQSSALGFRSANDESRLWQLAQPFSLRAGSCSDPVKAAAVDAPPGADAAFGVLAPGFVSSCAPGGGTPSKKKLRVR